MPQTPWSSSSSLVSDRIRAYPTPQAKSKGKGKPELPKSRAVRTLEVRLDGARGSDHHTKDPRGGCFCQARDHALSSYVPMCRQCGLILCVLNPPHYACPHCAKALLLEDKGERAALVRRLEEELRAQIAKEAAERQRAIEEARAAEGAFPMLPGSQAQKMIRTSRTPPPPPQLTHPSTTTRTVLSLNSETKRMTVSSYGVPMVAKSRPVSRGEEREEEEGRVPGPPAEVSYVKDPLDPGRPWRNVRTGDVKYVPLPGGATREARKRR